MPSIIKIKRYPHGKFFICSQGNPDYKEIAEKALVASIEVCPQLNTETFVDLMRKSNIPENVIEEYLESFCVENQTYSEDHPEMEMLNGCFSTVKVSETNRK